MAANPQLGLVLSGGGAKGAYQVGAVSYLAELGIQPQMIAGTSIGALNGAVLASNGSFRQAARRLDQVWDKLGTIPIIRSKLRQTEVNIRPTLQQRLIQLQAQLELQALFDPEPIEAVLKEAVDPVGLRNGTEFWVTVFPSLKLVLGSTFVDLVRARTGTNAHWLCAQNCPDQEALYNLLLASAAIPIAFPRRDINGQSFVDGGLADNVPLQALAARGCTHAIVIHLRNGGVWERYRFPGQTIIEIRPEQPIQQNQTPMLGLAEAFFDFSPQRIAELKQRGYDDAKRCMEQVIHTFVSIKEQRRSQHRLLDSTQRLLDDLPL